MDVEEQRENNVGGATGKGFLPGQSGNPGGRPKGRSLTARLRELLEKNEINGKPIPGGRQVADLVVEAMVKGAIKGQPRLLQEVYDRHDGKVTEKHEHTGKDGAPLAIDATVLAPSASELETWRQQQRKNLDSLRKPDDDPSST